MLTHALLRYAAFTLTLVAAQLCSGSEPQTNDLFETLPSPQSSVDTVQSSPPWQILDRVREQYVSGNTDSALTLLENLALDTIVQGVDFHNARRELTSYVLIAAGQHERAFDTLMTFTASRIGSLESERARITEHAQAEKLRLQLQLKEQQRRADARTNSLEAQHQIYLIGLGSISLFLLLLVLALAWRRRRSAPDMTAVPNTRNGPAAVVGTGEPTKDPVLSPQATEPATAPPTPQPIGGPMDVVIMHAHTSAISKQLNRGAAIEAAGHLGILDRFLRLLTEQGENGRTSVPQAMALLRQYLKLEILRMGISLSYSVDADRSLSDQVTLPVMPLAILLSRIIQGPPVPIGTQLSVELVPSEVGDEAQCIINYSSGPGEIPSVTKNAIPGLAIDQQVHGQEIILHVKWPVHQRGQAM